MPISFKNQTVTRVRPGTTVKRGDSVPNWAPGAVSELSISGCRFQPEIGNEQTSNSYGVGRDSVAHRGVLFAPVGADVLATDRVRIGTDTYEIDGPPRHWSSPTGALAHVELTLELVEG